MTERVRVEVAGRTLQLSNLEKVLFPDSSFTKAQVIEYYARIAPVLIPHLTGRCITLRRFPDGVEGESFYTKRCPEFRPDWLHTARGPGDRRSAAPDAGSKRTLEYCRIDEAAALVWTANLAAIELHAPMARCSDLESPTMLVFDLDPGPPATIVHCCAVALSLREVLDAVGLVSFAKTSGSKGLQIYVPLNMPHSHEQVADFALAVGQLLAKQQPDRVLVAMNKDQRVGKVFIDWSQNSRHKTTAAVYSIRAKSRPTVSTPVTWSEVADGATNRPLAFETEQVLDRVDRLGDLFAPTLSLQQTLPGVSGGSG